MSKNPYDVLGVPQNASDDEIKKSIPGADKKVSSGCKCEQSACRSGRKKNSKKCRKHMMRSCARESKGGGVFLRKFLLWREFLQ